MAAAGGEVRAGVAAANPAVAVPGRLAPRIRSAEVLWTERAVLPYAALPWRSQMSRKTVGPKSSLWT
jgi:hypothetical protein